MRTDMVNKAHEADNGCDCARCRVTRAGLEPGRPLTAEEYKLIAPPTYTSTPDYHLAADPDVKRAAGELERAEAAFDKAHDKWIATVAEQRSAELTAQRRPERITADGQPVHDAERERKRAEARGLGERAAELRIERDRAGAKLTEARQAHADATRRARWKAEQRG